MRCTLAKKLIPLYVSDDLPDEQMFLLREHLQICKPCRQLGEEFSENQLWLRTLAVPEFTETIFDDLRNGVQKEIVKTEPGKSWFQWLVSDLRPRFVLTASAVALLLIAVFGIYLLRHQPDRKGDVSAGGNGTHQNDAGPQKVIGKNLSGKKREGVEYGNHKRSGTRQYGSSAKRRSLTSPIPQQLPEQTHVATTDIPKNQEILRIEFQTADPNIRIIWFALMPDTSITDQSNTK